MKNYLDVNPPAAGRSELLDLLDRNWNAGIKDLPDTYRPPLRDVGHCQIAARLHAQANASDPYTAGRVSLHLKRGLDDPRVTALAAMSRLNAARARVQPAALDAAA